MNKLLTSKNNGKHLESALLILLGVVVAFTFFFAFTSVDLVANAEEENVIGGEPGANSVPIAPDAVLLLSDFEEELEPLFSTDNNFNPDIDLSSLNLTGGVYQIVCKAIVYGDDVFTSDDDYTTYLTNLVYIDSEFPSQAVSLSDYGYGDSFFTVIFSPEYLTADFFDTFQGYEDAQVLFYALYKIEEPSSSGVNVEQITDIMFDGVSFSANAIASSISYTFDNLFLNEDGSLTIYTQLVIWFAGISLLLSFVRLLIDWLFSLGGNKDKL